MTTEYFGVEVVQIAGSSGGSWSRLTFENRSPWEVHAQLADPGVSSFITRRQLIAPTAEVDWGVRVRGNLILSLSFDGEEMARCPVLLDGHDLTIHVTACESLKSNACNICGGQKFGRGPNGRTSRNARLPRCARCQSLERHRFLRRIYQPIAARGILSGRRALQLSPDLALETKWFSEYEVSIFGGDNHIDIQAIDREQSRYDWVICNHVLEHVEDDLKGMAELLRILSPDGVLQFTVPNPAWQNKTNDWGFPKESEHGHYRTYGRDLVDRFAGVWTHHTVLCARSSDPVTHVKDVAYLVVRDSSMVQKLQDSLESVIVSQRDNP